MAQHDMVIDNAPGLAVRTDINGALSALVTLSSGTVEPAVMYPGMLWLDTSVAGGLIRRRNIANTAWLLLGGSQFVERLYTAGTLWNKPANLQYLRIKCLGGGGAGGGVPATAAGEGSSGGGGGAGGYAEVLLPAVSLSASHTVSVGAGGGVVTGGAGGNGAASSLGVFCVANGGNGGPVGPAGGPAGSSSNGGAGGFATAGTITVPGGSGFGGVYMNGGCFYGRGADSLFGAGGGPFRWATGSQVGAPASGFGSGGAGAINLGAQGAKAGGAGAPGFVYVMEIF